ncbi:glycosyltransferase [Synechococcales cyanobacterium C]|uniref:Glycosyltransferase n=1 Tax=Petrachloros mirabilis ULC683 TaxID=2781853 RepID=A0A8K2A7P1_9CYAN|nr:glycosyltransferase [Petrachloros mirabilis]NCJ07129.1 glycosyltransferase [Petrachloros mirabilis ULC683]
MVSVGVFIDLRWTATAGGHVKCWEQFAEAATQVPEQLDLTLHLLGDGLRPAGGHRASVMPLSRNVRFVTHPSRFSTERISFLRDVPDHTDLAAYNSALMPYLEQHQVVHTTHPLFTFGKTARRYCLKTRKPLVTSIHTDTPQYARIYLEQMIAGLPTPQWVKTLLQTQLHIPDRYQAFLQAKRKHYLRACQHVWVSQPSDFDQVAQVLPPDRISRLRLGINFENFSPQKRDRTHLEQTYGIPPEKFLLLFVGRLDACKNVMVFAEAVQALVRRGLPVHAVVVGQGSSASAIQAALANHVSMLGSVKHQDLGRIFASCDLFVFPSETETLGSVVVEAKASGLPSLVSGKGGTHQVIKVVGEDGMIVSERDPQVWADQIEALYQNPKLLAHMRVQSSEHIRCHWPSWQSILIQDLLPIWTAVSHRHGQLSLPPIPCATSG